MINIIGGSLHLLDITIYFLPYILPYICSANIGITSNLSKKQNL